MPTTTPKKKTVKKRAPKKKVATKAKPAAKQKPKRSDSERDVIYPEVSASLCIGENPVTAAQSKKLLGWQEETENVKFGGNYHFKDKRGVKVRCTNIGKNRPLVMRKVEELIQEILRPSKTLHTKWRFNFEPIIIGKTGEVLNGQHSLIALILAVQIWEDHGGQWINWQTEPTIEKLIGFGCEEDDETVNTMDTCRPRTLSDVLYHCVQLADVKPKDRKAMARICAYAVNTVWERTGAENAFAPFQTHSESIEFLNLHPKLVEAVHHVYLENNDNSISRYLPLGYAAGMQYLMGASKSEPAKYIADPREASLDMSNWDKAQEFFMLLAQDAKEVQAVKTALGRMLEDDGGSRREKTALIAKSWTQWYAKGEVVKVSLRYKPVDGVRTLVENPSVGGIDLISHSSEDL